MRIVVSGASGSVGSEIVPLLSRSGHVLLLISRYPETMQARYPKLQVVSVDDWESQAREYDVFLHLAVMNNDSATSRLEFFRANADLTASYAEGALRVKIGRFIYPSTVQALLPAHDSCYVESKLAGEKEARKLFSDSVEIVYLGLVHGTRFSGKLSFLNRFPEPIGRLFFPIFSAFKPTTGAKLLADYATETERFARNKPQILTDPKPANFTYRFWRMGLNVGFVAAVILLVPVLLTFWLVIVLGSGRPGFFLQERLGRKGLSFRCAKFRTMKNGTESVGTHLVDEKSVTPLGSFLRRLKIDELPQAVNIALGQMTLIGPRPSLPTQLDVIGARELSGVVDYTPGLTGWAQVNGIDMSNPDKIAEYDAQYLGLQSVWLDVQILKRTLFRP